MDGPFTLANIVSQKFYNMKTEYTVGWGTLALLNAGIAQSKKRSGLNWFLISLLLGPVATLLLLTFYKYPPADS